MRGREGEKKKDGEKDLQKKKEKIYKPKTYRENGYRHKDRDSKAKRIIILTFEITMLYTVARIFGIFFLPLIYGIILTMTYS